jgi:replicative DNA helicase
MDVVQLSYLKQRSVEQYFAACMAVHPVATIEQCGWLTPDDLSSETIRDYWKLLRERVGPGMDDHQATETSIQIAFEVGIQSDVMKWMSDLPYMEIPQAYATEIVRRQYLVKAGQGMGKLATALGSQDDKEARKIIEDLASIRCGGMSIAPNTRMVAEKFEQIVMLGNRSVDTFIPPLDTATGGLERQTLTVIAARPSVGKTALIWQIARNVAQSGQQVIFFSLEMSAPSLWARAACPRVGITWRDVRAGRITKEKRDELIKESYILADQYKDTLRIIDVASTTESIWRTSIENKPDLIVVDHLRLVRDQMESEVKRLGMITERLKDIAKSVNCAALLAVQLSRESEKRKTNKQPQLSDMRDSGEIEENADLVCMLYRPDMGQNYTKPPKVSLTELWIRKFRDGPAGILVNLMFDTEQEWFDGRKL